MVSLVLVVEDNAFIAMDLEEVLQLHGWSVLGPVATVAGALRLLQDKRPDAAILDIRLRDGFVTPLAEALRALNVPIILASAEAHPDRVAGEVLKGPINVGKPIDEHRLLAALREATGSTMPQS